MRLPPLREPCFDSAVDYGHTIHCHLTGFTFSGHLMMGSERLTGALLDRLTHHV